MSYPPPVRIEIVPGTPFGVAILAPPRSTSGVAVGSLVTGIGSILVSVAVWCFGLLGANQGWGGLVAGAFCVLAVLLGIAGLVEGGIGLRQVRRAAGRLTGRGLALAGMICGGVGVALAIAGQLVAILLSASGNPTP